MTFGHLCQVANVKIMMIIIKIITNKPFMITMIIIIKRWEKFFKGYDNPCHTFLYFYFENENFSQVQTDHT